MTSNAELIECPFCGGNDVALHRGGSSGARVYWRAICNTCLKREAEPGREAAIEAWNTRALSKGTSEEIGG